MSWPVQPRLWKRRSTRLGHCRECAALAMNWGGTFPDTAASKFSAVVLAAASSPSRTCSILLQFVEQQGPALEQISTALAKGDLVLAERLAHTLKGVSGNIGAKAVQAAAAVVERLIRERTAGAELDAAREQAADALDPFINRLRAVFGSKTAEALAPATTVAVDLAKTRQAAAQLNTLLSEFDPGATDFIDANRALLQPLFAGHRWAEFEKLVQAYAFSEAQAQLEEALKKQPPL